MRCFSQSPARLTRSFFFIHTDNSLFIIHSQSFIHSWTPELRQFHTISFDQISAITISSAVVANTMSRPSDDAKNDFVIALQEMWSPHQDHRLNYGSDFIHDENSILDISLLASNCNSSFRDQDSDGTLLVDDTVKSMDLMGTQEQPKEAELDTSEYYTEYDEIEALLYGMEKSIIDHDQAVTLVRKYPKDPVMVAIQALLEKDSTTSQKLWEEAKDLGLLSKAKEGHGFVEAITGRMMEYTVTGVHYLAESWYEPAAEKGQATAQCFLAKSLEESQDFETAFSWYQKAAEQGHAAAQCRLGRLFRKGLVPEETRPMERAKNWFEKAAMQGCAEGQLNLAFVFYKERDPTLATYWYRLAVGSGEKSGLSRNVDSDLGTKDGHKRDGDSDSEKYWISKAQENLNQLFVKDHKKGTVASIDDAQTNQSRGGRKNSCTGRFLKMQLAELEGASTKNNKASDNTLTSMASWSSRRQRSATATLSSIMSIQSLSIGSKDALSIASMDSFRQAASFSRFEFDEKCNSFCEDDGTTWGQNKAGMNETDHEELQELLSDSEAMDVEEMTSPAPEQFVNSETDFIKPYFAIMGDKTARGPRLTAGTKELRNIKEWYKENRAAYQRRGCQSELFPDAMARYYQKMSELFDKFPSEQSQREKTFLVYCSKTALASGRVENPNCFRYANDNECQYGTAKFPEAVFFYFNSRDPPKLENVVARYRDLLDSRPGLPRGERNYFERYLEFCRMTLEKASDGCSTAQLAIERNNFIPTLKCLWEDVNKGDKNPDTP